jgi:hypothetical protein
MFAAGVQIATYSSWTGTGTEGGRVRLALQADLWQHVGTTQPQFFFRGVPRVSAAHEHGCRDFNDENTKLVNWRASV